MFYQLVDIGHPSRVSVYNRQHQWGEPLTLNNENQTVCETALVGFYAETPVHAGGSASSGAIDLTIQRNISSGIPVIWGHSLKGALKADAKQRATAGPGGINGHEANLGRFQEVFGGEPTDSDPTPGWLNVGEARLAAFPVPCFTSMMKWVTSPSVLSGVARLATIAGVWTPDVPRTGTNAVTPPSQTGEDDEIVLGLTNMALSNQPDPQEKVAQWAQWIANHLIPDLASFEFTRSKLESDLVLVPDGVIATLTREFAHIVVRNHLNEHKTVANLFTEECLPAESILVSLVAANQPVDLRSRLNYLDDSVMTLGGSSSVGHGLVWTHLASCEAAPEPVEVCGGLEAEVV